MLAASPSPPVAPDRELHVDFPLCRDPRHEQVIRRVLERCVAVLRDRLPGDTLVALVLTGSFARGEGSVMVSDGRLHVLGDIEFLVVMPSEAEFYRYRTQMPGWSRDASRQVADEITVDLEFGPAQMGYLRKRTRPSIFVLDLIRHGKVVYGVPDVLRVVPAFGPERIPREDALALLFNRTIEQLEAYDRAATLEGEALWHLAYQRLKLVLDIAGSALAFAGRHVSLYRDRPDAFAELVAATPKLRDSLPSGFQADLERAARLKVDPGDGTAVMPPDLGIDAQRSWIRRQILDGVPALTAVMHWELEELSGTPGDLATLLHRYTRAPGWSQRVWDWGKVVLHPLPPPVPLSRLRALRLFFRSTPRALLYAAGALTYLNLAGPTVRPRAITRMLFVRRAVLRRDPAAHRRAITALWRWCIRNM